MDGAITAPDGRVLFSTAELACHATGVVRLHPGFADELRALRLRWGRPMRVTSGCRSSAHNKAEGGASNSLHLIEQFGYPRQLGALAVDIAVMNSAERWELGFVAMGMGWSAGVPDAGFCHLDRRDLVGEPRKLFGYS